MQRLELEFDVTKAANLDGETATVAFTVHLPDPADLPDDVDQAVVCFAKPGGGYSRGYFTEDLPGAGEGSQAAWHAAQGWVFVSEDHIGTGQSSHPGDVRLDFTVVSSTAMAAEEQLLERLRNGTLADGFPALPNPLLIGIGQSMGGCMTIVQQGRHHCYDGIAVLGYSAVHTHPPTRPGSTPVPMPWLTRDFRADHAVPVNRLALANLTVPDDEAMGWVFHYDDVDRELVERDVRGFPQRTGGMPAWGTATTPGTAGIWTCTPGAVAPEAAAVLVPVLVGLGERDTTVDPRGELRAYRSSRSVDFFTCPRMGHMHNFAGTRELLWRRVARFADWVAEVRATLTSTHALSL